MKALSIQPRKLSVSLWIQMVILLVGFPSACLASPTVPPTTDFTVTNALLANPGATATSPQVTLYWGKSTGGTGSMTYQVYRSTTSGGPYTEIASSIAAATVTPSYIDTSIAAGTTYYYVVTATDTTGRSGYSTEMVVKTTDAPTSTNASGGPEEVSVAWTGELGISYNIYAASSTGDAWKVVKSNIAGTNGPMSYPDTAGPTGLGLQSGQTYYYAVAAVTGTFNLSETDSASVSAIPSGDPLGPMPNVTSMTTSGSTATVSLSWDAVPGATGYNIVRSTSTSGPWTCPASNCLLSTPQTITTYVDSSAASGTIEYYQVLATNDGGTSYGTSHTFGVSTTITTASFTTTGTGLSNKAAAAWSFDLKQDESSYNIGTYVNAAGGASMFTGVRVSWFPQYPLLLNDAALDPIAQSKLDYEAANAALVEHTSGTFLNFFLSPKTGFLDSSFYDSSAPPAINITKWVDAMQYSRDYYQNTYSANNATIAYNGIENEPDNTGCQFTSATFGAILNAPNFSGWGSTVQEGPDTFRAGDGALWLGASPSYIQAPQPMGGGSLCESTYTPIQNSTPVAITKASTHVIGGTPLADFKTFLTQARDTDGLAIWLPEIHSLAEPIVALNYGTAKGIARAVWWNPITKTRGDFMQISKSNNQLFYAFSADGLFAATSGYFNGTDTLAVFLANTAVDPTTFKIPVFETFTLKCTNQSVKFNGSGTATSTFTMTLPSADPSADNPGGEFEIPVTWKQD